VTGSTPPLPARADVVVIGAGIHGLSTAWHLGAALRAQGREPDVVVLDKSAPGAGASGIACGVVRNNYFQPAMRRLMAHSVDLWEQHAEALSYHPVGYLQVSPESMRADVASIHAQQQEIGYPSTFVEGEDETAAYLRRIFPDWRARGVTSVLHEKRGGYANNQASVDALARFALDSGARLHTGVAVTGFVRGDDGVEAVLTDAGRVDCGQVVVAVGPWVRDLWSMLGLPERVDVRAPDGTMREVPMWSYLALQEGTLAVDPGMLTDATGGMPPVVHLDSDAPLFAADGSLVTDRMWGVYFKPDLHFGGVQGGAAPLVVDAPAAAVAVDPYGPKSPDFVVGDDFARMWTAALVHAMGRFEGTEHLFSPEPSGGIGCFTPDSFPVVDTFHGNAVVVADSNHGYKMLGVGALVAEELLGRPQELLEPFRFDRYAAGRTHPVSHSPFPWS
jgi:glycine/D-amino acid oxidase-like deaminating enzyme